MENMRKLLYVGNNNYVVIGNDDNGICCEAFMDDLSKYKVCGTATGVRYLDCFGNVETSGVMTLYTTK